MGDALDRLQVKLALVVVPPGLTTTKSGKKVPREGYSYTRKGGKKKRSKSSPLAKAAPDAVVAGSPASSGLKLDVDPDW